MNWTRDLFGTRDLSPRLGAIGAALLLAGCINESASMAFSGRDHALTLDVRQKYPWSRRLDVDAVMIKLPDCHRRTRLESAEPAGLSVEILQPPEGAYAEPILILKQGDRHYALGRQNCEIQRFTATPKDLGQVLGRFTRASGPLQFVVAPKLAPQPVASVPGTATASLPGTGPGANPPTATAPQAQSQSPQ